VLGLFEAVFYVAYKNGMSFTSSLSAPFWFPDTVLLCALLLTPRRNWWLFLLATLPIRLLVAVPPDAATWFLLAAFANDCLKAVVSAYLIRRFIPDLSRIGGSREFGIFAAVAVILVPAVSALAGAACRSVLGFAFWPAWLQWFLGNALTNLVLTSSVLFWLALYQRPAAPLSTRRIIEGSLLTIGLGVTAFAAFIGPAGAAGPSTALLYAPVPFLLWAAVRFGPHGAAGALAIVAFLSVWSAAHGLGAFSTGSVAENVLAVQLFLFVTGVPMLLLAAVAQDRERVGAALRMSEERYRDVVESQTEMVCRYRADTTLTFVNDAYCRFFRRPREELLGHQFLEFIPPAVRDRVQQNIRTLNQERSALVQEHQVVLADGTVGWQHWEDFAIVGAYGTVVEFQGVGRDITERKLAEAALTESEARMSLAAEAAELSLWVWNVQTGEVWITDKRSEQLGMNFPEHVTYAEFIDRVDPKDRELVRKGIEHAMIGEGLFESEYRVAGSEKDVHWVASRGRCIQMPDGTATQFMGVSIDITGRKRVEEAMQGLVQSARLALLGELTASIAHEVNQPLTAILSNARAAELLLSGDAPDLGELREILADIRKSNLRASEVIRRVRGLVVKRELRPAAMDVNEVVNDVLRLVAVDAQTRGITLQADLRPALPAVQGDRLQIEEALLNLIVNGMDAMKANPPGQRPLRIGTASEGDDWVTLSVSDEGHGILPERLPMVFEAFFTTKEQGMGLGLALARSIAELHQGRIRAENNPGAGATFHLSLPCEAVTVSQPRAS
jgi:PAS domain S-box-containing protein